MSLHGDAHLMLARALLGVMVTVSWCDTIACKLSPQEEWIIPEGYVGWLRLDYSVTGTPALPVERGFYVVRMPRSGRLQTSSSGSRTIERNQYYIEGANGRDRITFSWPPVQGYAVQHAFRESVGDTKAYQPQFECVFVGTRSDFTAN